MRSLATILASLAVVVLCGCATVRESPAPPDPLFLKVAGTWGAETKSIYSCSEEPHTITFSDDFSRAIFRISKPIPMADGTVRDTINYKVLKVEGNVMTMFVEGETRKTGSGDPVVWSLVLVDDNRYYWRRTDWEAGSGTSHVLRCQAANQSFQGTLRDKAAQRP